MNIEQEIEQMDKAGFEAVSRMINWINESSGAAQTVDRLNVLNDVIYERAVKDLDVPETKAGG